MDNNNNNNINNNNNQSSLPQPSAPPDPSVTPPHYQPSSSSPNSQLQQPQPQLVTPQLPSQQQQEEEDEPSTLRVPTTTPQQRRKRGLSLRSQLFNKAFNLQSTSPSPSPPPPPAAQPSPPSPQTQSPPPVDVNELNQGNIELLNLKKPAPTINVTEATPRESTGTYPSFNPNLATSTTHLTAISSTQTDASSAGASFISKRERQQFLRYKTHSKTLQTFIDFKNRLLGINNLPPTIAGRVIPLSINHKSINEYFQDNYYDEKHDSLIDERCNKPYINNTITSSKYTVYDFLPKQLKAQFSKIANCYFMVVAIMQMIPGWSTTGQYTTIIPLCIFMSISIAREGFDDWKRHGHDKEENNKRTTILKEDQELGQFDTHSITTIMTDSSNDPAYSPPSSTSSGSSGESTDPKMAYTDPNALKRYNLKEYNTTWHEVKVGDIVKINENEWFPADVLLISTSDLDTQIAYVETMALDGETNLKPKYPHTELAKLATNVTSLKNLKTLITTEDPNIDLYNFEGSFQLNDETYSLGPDNIVYRGSILRNTKSVLGLVVFTGEETKIRMNNIKHPRTKAPKLQKNINYIVMFMVLVVLSLSCFSTMAQRLAYQRNRDRAWYLFEQDAGVAATMMGFIIMYNTLIPLSLYVTMEIIKVMQLCFLQFDIDMYHVESNTPADAKTATILEELGQVSYIFSDKTGTLTDNKMVFRKFSVCGVSWLHDLDLMADERANPNSFATAPLIPRISMHAPQSPRIQPQSRQSRGSTDYVPRTSTTSIVRNSMDVQSMHTTWTSSAHPNKVQNLSNSLQLLRHIQSHPQTLFAKRAKFFLLSIALCNTCLPRKQQSTSSKKKGKPSEPNGITPDNSSGESSETMEDEDISYQAASPDELALVQAARDLGYVVFDRQNNRLIIRTYPDGFDKPAKLEEYTVLEVIEFTSSRKRMSIVVKFPDGRIGIVCKGADSIILERLKNSKIAEEKAREISIQSSERKTQEADVILNSRKSYSVDVMTGHTPRKPSIRQSLSASMVPRTSSARLRKMSSIDNALMGTEEEEIADIANRARKSLHLQQSKKYSLDVYENDPIAGSTTTPTAPTSPVRSYSDYSVPLDGPSENAQYVPNDKLLVNDEFIIEKTLEHLEEFSTEGLRTLLYSFKCDTNRAQLVEQVGGKIEHGLDLIGATAIEDKLQDGVSEAIDKLRRAP
ncbi:uncharacterized protein J8A68_000471 [[Candida] subhashii]|uniref:P-type ATPase N-terminal domain-containing protein n=1 Tax=[Candida] subhashii TaxID=561895 RepID=A0A8J5QT19_9ASCO|nr:uncharacterized protein J8A68_000471 [[Candida] subhashii]KAG7666041.1 hypothetical protein J8A68_000471 [[Candida] subhashii]